nr:RNA-directed DNA polymerase, eukaryota, reverse transcriptase zinc-binding domain protein [Tanacetum cinerariifolium]
MVLDDSCLNEKDYSLCLMGNVKDFATLGNLKVVVANEGFDNIKFKYMGGYWVMMEFQTKVTKLKFQENSVMKTWFSQIQLASFDFNTDGRDTWVEIEGIPLKMWSKNTFNRVASKWGKVFWVRAKEIPGWILDFMKDNDEEENSEAIEGDENSKYYHGVINKKRNQLSIRGILVEGTWIDSHSLVKSEFLSHFKNRFKQPNSNRLHINMHFSNTLNSVQVADLECQVSKEEIKKAVWDCGIDKSPGLDGFTFGFYHRYWKLIENDVVDAVKDYRPISLIGSMYKIISKILANRLVVVLGGLVNEFQSAFVADKQILDGPFILNELVQWCKKKNKQSLIFKVDFEKAYDSIKRDHLDDIMRKFGFGEMRCMWIQSCLRSSRGSVIVNGSLDVGLFKGIELAPSLNLSHMFYAHDAIFMGQWSESNIDTIVKVLDCFNRASGLRINMTKSKLLGIYVEDDKSWNETIERMACRLSKWKLKTLSIRGASSYEIYAILFFNGAELSSKKSVWVKWKHALAPKDKGGL